MRQPDTSKAFARFAGLAAEAARDATALQDALGFLAEARAATADELAGLQRLDRLTQTLEALTRVAAAAATELAAGRDLDFAALAALQPLGAVADGLTDRRSTTRRSDDLELF
jgi:hypothetical protein